MRENVAAHRVYRIPPELSDLYTSVIYGDTDSKFTSVLIHGVEMQMLLFVSFFFLLLHFFSFSLFFCCC